MLLHEIVELAARRAPSETAVVSAGESITFSDLHDRVTRVGGAIADLVAPGARVAILAENVAAYVDCYYAVPRASAILTLLNYRLHPLEWAATIDETGSEVLVAERALLDRLGSDLPAGVVTVVVIDEARPGETSYADLLGAEPSDARATAEHDVAWIIATSGTTGRSKGAMLTHRSLLAAVTTLSVARPVQADDVYLFPFPLCHVAGYNVLAFHLHGRPVVLMRRFEAGSVVEHVNTYGVTQVSLAPTMIDMLLRLPGIGHASMPTLRGIGYGAAAIPADVLRRADAHLGCDLSQGYGMTELSGNVVFLDAEDHRQALLGDESLIRAAGRPSPFVGVRVVDDDLADVPVGEVGEIVVRGDQVFAGYWNDPAASAESLRGGWFRTGDLGRFDRRGYLFVVDRKKDVIVTGGENVASREVEDVLRLHPGVREVAVIGVPDETWGENVCAVVVPAPDVGITAEDLIQHARQHLAGYKKPKHVAFVDELPKNHAGKVLKTELRARFGDSPGL